MATPPSTSNLIDFFSFFSANGVNDYIALDLCWI